MELPRGMKDVEPDELIKIEHIRQKFQETAQLFGFRQMDPSPLESLETLEAKGGKAIKDEIYFFKDKGDRDIALRFDFTVGLTRYVVSQKSLRMPAKFSAFGGVWRYDEPQRGRYRYFHQWNVEIYGKQSLESEAEILEFTSRLFDALKIQNISIDINHRTLVQSYINKVFESNNQELVSDILRAIDKIQKKSRQDVLNEYKKKGYDSSRLDKILDFANIKASPKEIQEKHKELVTGLDGWTHLTKLIDSLKNRDVENVRINFGIVRGLDYYSGMVFEVFDTASDLGALAGGGTYDALTKAFGRDDISATGVAGGVERMILTMEGQEIASIIPTKMVSVVYVNEEMQTHAMSLASKLRQKQIPVTIDVSGKSLSKQMEYAAESAYAIIVGPKEYADDSIVLRNMKDGKENTIKINNLLESLSSILNL
ncbi:MAG TPA: histidine--tRNA ligase [Nitrosopumilaceae archaeon]|nr:histidine--tRNA ligase [Nitrosopumilaceae archaeon]